MKPPMEKILEIVSNYFNVTTDYVRKRANYKTNVYPRKLCVYLMYKYCNVSLNEIAKVLVMRGEKGFHHTTMIIHNQDIKNKIYINDEVIVKDVTELTREILPLLDNSVNDRIRTIATLLSELPGYRIQSCETFGDLAKQLYIKSETKRINKYLKQGA